MKTKCSGQYALITDGPPRPNSDCTLRSKTEYTMECHILLYCDIVPYCGRTYDFMEDRTTGHYGLDMKYQDCSCFSHLTLNVCSPRLIRY